MADTGGFPRWLLKSKDQIIKTAVCIYRNIAPCIEVIYATVDVFVNVFTQLSCKYRCQTLALLTVSVTLCL